MSPAVKPAPPAVELTPRRVLAALAGQVDSELATHVRALLVRAATEPVNEGPLDDSDVVLTSTLNFEVSRAELLSWLAEWSVS